MFDRDKELREFNSFLRIFYPEKLGLKLKGKKMKKWIVAIIVALCIGCFGGHKVGWQAGFNRAWTDYEQGFNDGIRSPHNIYKRELQTSKYQWTGYMDDLAEILCEQRGIAYEVNEPTLGYKIVCPKCVCGGALYQQEQRASMHYGFHHVTPGVLEKLKSDESVDLSVDYRGQTYCAKCLYPVGTDWKIVDLSEKTAISKGVSYETTN